MSPTFGSNYIEFRAKDYPNTDAPYDLNPESGYHAPSSLVDGQTFKQVGDNIEGGLVKTIVGLTGFTHADTGVGGGGLIEAKLFNTQNNAHTLYIFTYVNGVLNANSRSSIVQGDYWNGDNPVTYFGNPTWADFQTLPISSLSGAIVPVGDLIQPGATVDLAISVEFYPLNGQSESPPLIWIDPTVVLDRIRFYWQVPNFINISHRHG